MGRSMTQLPFPRVLLGPGPSSVPSRVLQAMGRAPVGYLDPELFTTLDEISQGLRAAFGTSNRFTIAQTGTGMAGMEACFVNLIEPGDEVLIGVHGFFGARMCEIATRSGAKVHRVDAPWGEPLDVNKLADAAKNAGQIKLVGVVHAETSTGVLQPLSEIGELAKKLGALFLADTVTSLGGLPVELDKNGVDVAYSATQKCMGCPPGLTPISVSDRALDRVKSRKTPVQSWYHDWLLLDKYWSADRMYHHTVPVCLLMGLCESLRDIKEEGLENRFKRHSDVSRMLMTQLDRRGYKPFAKEGFRLPTLNSLHLPAGVDDVAIRKRLLTEYGLEIGGGLGDLKGKVWRIGTMGESAQVRNVAMLVAALDNILG